jgi:guanidinoacetate N-methyltransferase
MERERERELRLQEELRAYASFDAVDRQAWRRAPAVIDGHTLKILGHPVMEDWERPYMARLADIATRRGGQVLEVGFGMGISASYINASRTVTRHLIVEANRDVAELARGFAADPERHSPVVVLEGFWEDLIDQVEDGSCGGILYDAYPMDESEMAMHLRFAATAYRKLEPGGYFTYYADEVDGYGPEHLRALVDAGFDQPKIGYEVVPVSPPPDCPYRHSDTIVAPILVK